jgi:adenylate kinase
MNSMIVILFGPPGAGKGTQGALLAERFGMLRLSTGDLLRDAVRAGSPLGREAKSFMDAGELVPDELILRLVKEKLSEPGTGGVLFDGFPRTIPQAEKLDELLQDVGRSLDRVLVLDVPDEVIVERLGGRRSCRECGRIFNVQSDPAARDGRCDVCGGELVLRSDDEPATVKRRLDVYRAQTEPVLDYYRATPTAVVTIDGDRDVEQVQDDLVRQLEPS